MQPAVELRDVVCVLGRFPALAGASLSVERGEVVLLEGPNGAGKSTLLRLCAGLLVCQSGTASILGHDLSVDRVSMRRRVGLLGHGVGLYEELSVSDNVHFWTRAAGQPATDVNEALGTVGLDGRLADVEVARLSTGQRRRAALAVLLMRRAELWLLDEPHAGLDAQGRDLVDSLVGSAVQAGVTVLIASHDLERASSLADRTCTVSGGVVVDSTRVDDVTDGSLELVDAG